MLQNPSNQWKKYKRRLKHQEPHVITWTEMKKELCWHLGKEHVYIDKMYDKWQKATQRIGQTGKEFGAYLQFIRSNLLYLNTAGAPNKTQLIHYMRQGLSSEICAALYRKTTIPNDWLIFFEPVARAKSSIYLEHKSSFHAGKPTHNREKPIDKSTKNGYSFNSHNTHIATIARGNCQAQSQGCGSCGGCGGRNSHKSH